MNLNGDNLTDASSPSLNLTKDSQITMVANMSFFATDAGPLVA